MNKLLRRQIKKFLLNPEEIPEDFKLLLDSVSNAYDDFNQDIERVERSLMTSSKEISDINRKLKVDADAQRAVLDELRAAIRTLAEEDKTFEQAANSKNPVALASALHKIVEERQKKEKEFKEQTKYMQRMNDMMMGREMRIIELKKELKNYKLEEMRKKQLLQNNQPPKNSPTKQQKTPTSKNTKKAKNPTKKTSAKKVETPTKKTTTSKPSTKTAITKNSTATKNPTKTPKTKKPPKTPKTSTKKTTTSKTPPKKTDSKKENSKKK